MGDHNTQKIMTSNETRLAVEIPDLSISEVIYFNLAQKPRLKKMLDFSSNVSKCYQHTNINLTHKGSLDVIHDQSMKRNLILIKKESDIYGLLFLGNGATISIITLLNILVSGNNLPVAVLDLVDFQGHLADGGEKNGTFICNIFLDHFKIIDPHKSILYVIMFDGASNVQLAGELLKICYPNITVMRGVEHTVSLFFNDVSKIPVFNQGLFLPKMSCSLSFSGM